MKGANTLRGGMTTQENTHTQKKEKKQLHQMSVYKNKRKKIVKPKNKKMTKQ